jgi:hypothetical protein
LAKGTTKYRTVVAHLPPVGRGLRAACGAIGGAFTAAAPLAPYPSYSGNLSVGGTVAITETAVGIAVLGTVTGLEPNAVGGIHVHAGVSCDASDDPGGHYYPNMATDPWLHTFWASNAQGVATVGFPLWGFSVGNGGIGGNANVAGRTVRRHLWELLEHLKAASIVFRVRAIRGRARDVCPNALGGGPRQQRNPGRVRRARVDAGRSGAARAVPGLRRHVRQRDGDRGGGARGERRHQPHGCGSY